MDFYIQVENNRLQILDGKTGFPVFIDTPTFSYTYLTDDITKGERSADTTPYDSREGIFTRGARGERNTVVFRSENEETTLTIEEKEDVVYFDLQTLNENYSEFGLNLPFNFMGKFNGGGYTNQYLFNSPYISEDNKIKFCYLSNINGRNLVVLFLDDADGWKVEYSKFLGGHYFDSLKCLASFDGAYRTGSSNKTLLLAMFIVKDFNECLERVSAILHIPMLSYEKSYTFDGKGELTVHGKCDKVEMVCGADKKIFYPDGGKVFFDGANDKTKFIPYFQGKKGGDCSVYGYREIFSLWKKANDVASAYTGEYIPDDNACEGQCWVESLLRYELRFGKSEETSNRLERQFTDVLMQVDEKKAKPRATILEKPFGEFPAYHVFKSTRIQEQFFAVEIFLNAYKYFGEEGYLRYCLGALDTLIEHYQKEDGRIERLNGNGVVEDYSTVTCLIIPIIDVAVYFRDKDEVFYQKYAKSAHKLAEFIYERGFSFPTEGGVSELAEEEFEDGSISCSALSLLYYSVKLERVEKYIQKAKEFLDFHEAWVMRTPDCNIYGSSLRWWETRWEGDGDGPGLCCGHGWTIWRAEADYWYYKLTNDKEYLNRSLCAFTTNFAKFNPLTGEGKSIFSMDYIPGGGLTLSKDRVKYKVSLGLPNDIDVRLAYYVWNRADETIFNEKQLKI